MEYPKPDCPLIISAAMIDIHPIDKPTLKPVKICGKIAGKYILKSIADFVSSIERAVLMISGLIEDNPSYVFIKTAGKTPIKTIVQEARSLIPNASITNGIQAIGGGNLGASKTKLKMKFLFKNEGRLNRKSPKLTPITKAKLPPHKTRAKLDQQFSNISL